MIRSGSKMINSNFMRAFVLEHAGGVENLVHREIEKPVAGADEVLIRVKSLSVNPVDTTVRRDTAAQRKMMRLNGTEPYVIIGWDIAGVIETVGKGVTSLSVGDEVFGMVNFPGQGKAYAEYVVAPATQMALKPANISFEQAAASTLAALTAYQALVDHGNVKNGDRVLIHSASGGVGHYAVQIAKQLGAFVYATASGANRDFVLSLGADAFIDYQTTPFEDVVHDADMVLDMVSGDLSHLARSISVLKDGGKLVSIRNFFSDEIEDKLKARDIYGIRMLVASSGKNMKTIADMLESGGVKSHVSQVFEFDELPLAHTQVETGKTRGKVVVHVG
jgi:NADPH:quinone reductase-like Zn-dependent oxidoreductase